MYQFALTRCIGGRISMNSPSSCATTLVQPSRMCRFSDSALYCVRMYTRRRSELMQLERVISMMRYCPPKGTAGFARSRVSGNSRSPAPPARSTPRVSLIGMIASHGSCLNLLPSRCFVGDRGLRQAHVGARGRAKARYITTPTNRAPIGAAQPARISHILLLSRSLFSLFPLFTRDRNPQRLQEMQILRGERALFLRVRPLLRCLRCVQRTVWLFLHFVQPDRRFQHQHHLKTLPANIGDYPGDARRLRHALVNCFAQLLNQFAEFLI